MKIKLNQFFKFLIAGSNNTALDFLVLNILMQIFNVYSGGLIILFNSISFSLAVCNSYLVNQAWTFRQQENKKIKKTQIFLVGLILLILFGQIFRIDFLSIFLIIIFLSIVFYIDIYIIKNYIGGQKFSAVSLKFSKFIFLTLIGMIINSGIFYFVSSYGPPLFGLSTHLWANFAKAIATIITLFWNFFSYKAFVFKD